MTFFTARNIHFVSDSENVWYCYAFHNGSFLLRTLWIKKLKICVHCNRLFLLTNCNRLIDFNRHKFVGTWFHCISAKIYSAKYTKTFIIEKLDIFDLLLMEELASSIKQAFIIRCGDFQIKVLLIDGWNENLICLHYLW